MARTRWLIGVGLAGGVGLWWLLRHVPRLPTLPAPQPAQSIAEAEARLAELEAATPDEILPICRSKIFTHTARAKSVVILLHGYTSCPQQYVQLAALLQAVGHAVFVPRLPYHGQVNRVPTNLAQMTPSLLVDFMGEVLDIAAGLGEHITVLGLSFGGVLAAWAAQQRPDIAHAILVSPALGLMGVKPWLRRPMTNLMPWLPDQFRWWNTELREQKLGPTHMYVGYSLRGVAMMLGLGNAILAAATRQAPVVRQITLLLNANDSVVDSAFAHTLAQQWQSVGAAVTIHEYPASYNLPHDFIDPEQPDQQVAQAYPVICALIGAIEETVVA